MLVDAVLDDDLLDDTVFDETVFDGPVFDETVFDEGSVGRVDEVVESSGSSSSDTSTPAVDDDWLPDVVRSSDTPSRLVEADPNSAAESGSTTSSSTTETPAQATPTAAALAANHIENNMRVFMIEV